MKRAIKVILLGICLSMLCAFSVSAADLGDKAGILEYLGIIDEETALDETATRADMAEMFAKAMTDMDLSTKSESSEVTFEDLDRYDDAYGYAAFLYEKGILVGQGDNNFYPENPVQVEHAAKIVTKLLGAARGFNDASYTSVLNRIGIKVKTQSINMTNGELAELIYEMLVHDVYDIDRIEGGNYYVDYTKNGTVYIEKVFGIYEVEGIVSADDKTSIYSKNAVKDGYYTINDVDYKNETGIKDLLGMKIKGFAKNDEQEGEILVVAYPYKTNVMTITADMVEKYEDNKYEYTLEKYDEKTKNVKLKKGFTAIYNGTFVGANDGFNATHMVPKSGSVTLIDNDNDNVYDIAIIYDYVNDLFSTYDKNLFKIYTESHDYKYDEDKLPTVTNDEGNTISLDTLKDGDIVSVAVNFDGNVTGIILSKKTVTGVVKSISTEDEYIKVDDGLFYYIPGIHTSKFSLGEGGTFYLNFENKIVSYKVTTVDGWYYCYYQDCYEEEDEEKAVLKLFSEDGREVRFKVAKKVSMDGDEIPGTFASVDVAIENATTKVNGDIADRKLIRVQLNSAAEVKYIDTLNVLESDSTIHAKNKPTRAIEYRKDTGLFDTHFAITDKTKIFCLPQDANDDMFTITISDFQASQVFTILGAYTTNPDSVYADAILISTAKFIEAKSRAQLPCLVEKIEVALNKYDEPVHRLTLTNYKTNQFTVETENLDCLYDRSIGKTVSVGDTIRYGINRDGYIDKNNVMIIHDVDEDKEYNPTGDIYSYTFVRSVNLIDQLEGFLKVSYTNDTTNQEHLAHMGKAVCYIWDTKTGKARLVTANELKTWKQNKVEKKAVIMGEYGTIYSVFMYD